MKRSSFQIEPTAQFTAGRPASKLDALSERLFGRTISRERSLAPSAAIAVKSFSEPSEAIALRKRSPLEALQIQNIKTGSQASLRKPPKVPVLPAQSLPRTVGPASEYKGFLITVAQAPDGRWTASYVRLGFGQDGACLAPKRLPISYLARFLAVTDAELEIDDLAD